VQAILDGLGPIVTDEVRQQVLAAVTVGDERNALISAASGLVSTHAAAVAAQLRAETITGGDFDVVAAIGEHAHEPAQSVVDSLDAVRNTASWFRPLTALVGALLALAAAIGLVWLHRESPRRALGVLAIALVVAGCVQLLVWLMAAWLVPTPFDPATSAGSVSWDLPSGLRSLLSDIQHALLGDVVRFGVWMALVVVVPGIVLGAVVVFAGVRIRRSMLMVVTAIGVVVAGVAMLGSARLARTPVARGCNGHAELCDRHYNDVVFAATHNSMSSPDVVRVWPEQDDDLGEQLDAGVRALLIDTHYWPPVRSARDLLEVQSAVAPDAPPVPQSVADALYPTLGSLRDGRPGTFLCHAHCAFGEQPFLDGLVSVRRFLEANPDEVVTLIIQDAISTPDTVAAMHAAGLDRYLYEHRRDHTWPTLGQMIDDGQRLVVFAEVAGPPPGWYANAFQEMQETGFTTPSPSAFSCAANRGPSDAPLFLMNHWVARGAPDRVNATIVNTKDFLVERARACARDRGLRPNFIAVDFSNIGDVVGAVDELNGVSS
jgi:hypothetical protein